ncbi:MAG: T9SS type A sorting domain-containing protein [Bacteroidota bacterium]
MKNKVLYAVVVLIACSVVNLAYSQISDGGVPVGFGYANLQIPVVEMPVVNTDSLKNEDLTRDQYKEIPYRFGYNHFQNLNPSNSGAWTTLANGDKLWQMGIHCPDALTVNIAFDQFLIPDGAKLFIYNQDHSHVIGAFTAKANQADHQLGCDLVRGNTIIVEYYEPANVSFHGSLNIFRITHGYRSLFQYLMKSFGNSGSCETNVICDPAWALEKRAVACIVENGNEACTGALINDVPSDGTPYFLTANHCGSSGFGTWVFRFNWESATCPNPSTSPASVSLSGAVQKAFNVHSDFNLLQLNSTPPPTYNVFYAGWYNPAVFADSAIAIHHPNGDIKKISHSLAPTHDGGMQDMGNGLADVWRIGQWTDGVTEPGSSGSPLFNQDHRIIGQLYGGSSACNAAGTDLNDVYGKFSTSWSYGTAPATRLKDWLDPTGTGTLVNDGYDPNAILPLVDAGILNINNPVQTNYCNPAITPTVVLRNFGSAAITSVTINYQLDGSSVSTYNWTGSLASRAMTTVIMPAINPTDGVHIYKVYTSSPNASTDLNHANDTATVTFTTQINTFPLREGFDHNVFPYQTWRIANKDGYDTWYRRIGVGGFGLSIACAEMDNFTNANIGQTDTLYSPLIDFSSSISPIKLTFSVAYVKRSVTANDSLIVGYSTNCGANWTRVYAKGGSGLASVPVNQNTAFTPTNAQWRSDTVALNALAGQSNVMFAFINYSDNGNNLYLDDINFTVGASGDNYIANDHTSISVYPNPTDGNLNVSITSKTSETVAIEVLDIMGQQVAAKKIGATTGGTYTLDLANQADGIYFVRITTATETIVRKVTIKK